MKRLTLLTSVLLLACTSCSRYQLSLLNSTDMHKDNTTGAFTMENDTVKVTYSFYGKQAPLSIAVFNKTNTALYINWQQSALVIGDNAINYAGDKIQINGSISGVTTYSQQMGFSEGSLSAVATLPKEVTFIPPHSQITHTPIEIAGWVRPVIADSLMKPAGMIIIDNQATTKVKEASFTQNDSPLTLRSYLTLYTSNAAGIKPVIYQNEFFVSKVISTMVAPDHLQELQNKRGDYIYSSKKTAYGKIMTGVGVGAAVAGVAAVNESLSHR